MKRTNVFMFVVILALIPFAAMANGGADENTSNDQAMAEVYLHLE